MQQITSAEFSSLASAPVELDASLLHLVGGGLPKGTWSEVMALPKGTWSESLSGSTEQSALPKGTW